jgi:uracil-DNA glycosylase family 4
MSLTRQERLQALGLWPAWRLRTPAEMTHAADIPAESKPVVAAAPPASPLPEPARPINTALDTLRMARPVAPSSAPPTVQHEPDPATSVAAAAQTDVSPLGDMDWTALTEAILSCNRCELAKTRTRAVPGVGDPHAEWLFIGEAPGANEDRQGEPFVGDAGKLLDAILAAIGLARGNNVFIANVLKSRPPGNRDPKPEEVATCLPFLERQIELIQPKLIVALGRFAAQSLLATDTPIGRLRGQVHRYRGVPLVVTYHPAYLLRNPLDKAKVWEDLVLARDTMLNLKQ